jgi:hypothetical protein
MISVILTAFLLFVLIAVLFVIAYYSGIIPNTNYYFKKKLMNLVEGIIRSSSCDHLKLFLQNHKLWIIQHDEYLGWVHNNLSNLEKIDISALSISNFSEIHIPKILENMGGWTLKNIKDKMGTLCSVSLDSSSSPGGTSSPTQTPSPLLTDASCATAARASKCMIGENKKELQVCTPSDTRYDGCCYRMIHVDGHPTFGTPTCVPIGDSCNAPGAVKFVINQQNICRPKNVCPEDRDGNPIDIKRCKFLEKGDNVNIESFVDTYRVGGNKCVGSMFPKSVQKDNKVKVVNKVNFVPSKNCVSPDGEFIIPEPETATARFAYLDSRRIKTVENENEICV